jgi:excisionase family DNA binding protein
VFGISGIYDISPDMSKTKAQAAEFLGVGIRAVERYSEQGRLTVRYEKGKTRPVAVYDEKELKALKAELKSSLEPPMRPQVLNPANTEQPDSGISGKPVIQQSLALTGSTAGTRAAQELATLFKLFESARQPAITDLAAKPLLTRAEAQRYTGLSKEILRAAVEQGKLKEILLGKAYRIKRADLDEFIKKL